MRACWRRTDASSTSDRPAASPTDLSRTGLWPELSRSASAAGASTGRARSCPRSPASRPSPMSTPHRRRREGAGRTRRPSPKCFASLAAALKAVECDLVLATLRTEAHFPVVREALNAGHHVVVEKPFASTIAQAKELVALAAEKERVLMVSQNYRYYPAPILATELLAKQALGAAQHDRHRLPLSRADHRPRLSRDARSSACRHVDPPFRPDAAGARRRAEAGECGNLEPRRQPVCERPLRRSPPSNSWAARWSAIAPRG